MLVVRPVIVSTRATSDIFYLRVWYYVGGLIQSRSDMLYSRSSTIYSRSGMLYSRSNMPRDISYIGGLVYSRHFPGWWTCIPATFSVLVGLYSREVLCLALSSISPSFCELGIYLFRSWSPGKLPTCLHPPPTLSHLVHSNKLLPLAPSTTSS